MKKQLITRDNHCTVKFTTYSYPFSESSSHQSPDQSVRLFYYYSCVRDKKKKIFAINYPNDNMRKTIVRRRSKLIAL